MANTAAPGLSPQCNNDYVPVCGSNGDTYQNECYLKQAACKQQSEILLVSEGSCATGTYCVLQAACPWIKLPAEGRSCLNPSFEFVVG